jgi:hypothetical protein
MRAPFAPLALALVACQGFSVAGDTSPDPGSAGEAVPASSAAADSWPTPPAYDLDADVKLRESLASEHFGGDMHVHVQDGVFVLAARDYDLLPDAERLTRESMAALVNGRFSRRPTRAVTVYVLDHRPSFDFLCQERLGRPCNPKWLGLWVKETREILVDQSLGRTTLVHELVHPLLEETPGLPRWLREGIAALFEAPAIFGADIHGTTNWRLDDLQRALGSPSERELVHLDALFRMPDDLFDGEHALAAYAVARFACQWMDSPEQDRLWRFFRTWKEHAAADPRGETSFAEVFGQTPREADDAWQKWVRSLQRPGTGAAGGR